MSVVVALVRIRGLSEDHLIEQHPKRPEIHLQVVWLLEYDLGSHINWSAQNGSSDRVGMLQDPSESQVADLEPTIAAKDVFWLKIAMNHWKAMQSLQIKKAFTDSPATICLMTAMA